MARARVAGAVALGVPAVEALAVDVGEGEGAALIETTASRAASARRAPPACAACMMMRDRSACLLAVAPSGRGSC
jgi:hypothetical protein